MNWKWTLPPDVQRHLAQIGLKSDHLGLVLDKFTPYAEYEYQERGQNEIGYRLGEKNLKRDWLKDAIEHAGRSQNAVEAIIAHRKRWRAMVKGLGGQVGYFVNDAPLIVGLGAEHVLETAITLDRNTGAPVIPGTGVKGLTRTAGLFEIAERLVEAGCFSPDIEPIDRLGDLEDWIVRYEDTGSAEALDELGRKVFGIEEFPGPLDPETERLIAGFRAIFGTPGKAGDVIFPDGVYAGNTPPQFYIDLMNPHFGKYYMEADTPPSDDLSPVPVPYLTVASGQRFAMGVMPRTRESKALLPQAASWLKQGVEGLGVGAKTAQGYGLFHPVRPDGG